MPEREERQREKKGEREGERCKSDYAIFTS